MSGQSFFQSPTCETDARQTHSEVRYKQLVALYSRIPNISVDRTDIAGVWLEDTEEGDSMYAGKYEPADVGREFTTVPCCCPIMRNRLTGAIEGV